MKGLSYERAVPGNVVRPTGSRVGLFGKGLTLILGNVSLFLRKGFVSL